VATGADPYSLLAKRSKPLDIFGRPYGPESFGITKYQQWPEDQFERARKSALVYLEALLSAANSPQKKRFLALLLSFDNWLQTARREFGLEAESVRQLCELTQQVDPDTGKQIWRKWTTAAFALINERGNIFLPLRDPPEPWARDVARPRLSRGPRARPAKE
jgi:hypothetical protein